MLTNRTGTVVLLHPFESCIGQSLIVWQLRRVGRKRGKVAAAESEMWTAVDSQEITVVESQKYGYLTLARMVFCRHVYPEFEEEFSTNPLFLCIVPTQWRWYKWKTNMQLCMRRAALSTMWKKLQMPKVYMEKIRGRLSKGETDVAMRSPLLQPLINWCPDLGGWCWCFIVSTFLFVQEKCQKLVIFELRIYIPW